MVWPVSVRIASSLLALSREDHPDRCALPRLWAPDSGGDPGWNHSEGRTQGCDRVCGCALLEVVSGRSQCLKYHEPLPVGRARSELGQVRSCYNGRNHSSPGSREALFRAVLPQADGPELGFQKS